DEGELTVSVSCVISVSPPPAQQPEDSKASFLASIGKDHLRRIRDSARRTLAQATASIFCNLVRARCGGLERTLRNGDKHLTRTSSAAATGSAAENLQNCFNHKKCERAAGSRRLQRIVRPLGFIARIL